MIIILIILLLGCFAYVTFFGAPYLPTLKNQKKTALDMLDLKPGQLIFEPGCGDGRVLLAAAKRGIKGIGYELNPIMYLVAIFVTWRYRKLTKIRFGNYWKAQWPKADGIYIFLLQKYMSKMHKKIIQSKLTNVKVVSYAFKIPNKKVNQKNGALFLYKY
ncbi:MAG: hypothetical protein WCP03_03940 [Candidatus Saccharibacteria bacterium]